MIRFTIILASLIFCLWISQAKCKSLRVMSYNIRIGIGMDGNTDLTRVADVINRIAPDYVGLQEVDSVCERSGWVNQYVSSLCSCYGTIKGTIWYRCALS